MERVGRAISVAAASTIAEIGRRPDYAWIVRFAVPYSLNSSKNRVWSLGGDHRELRQQANAYRSNVEDLTRRAMRGVTVAQNKVWISFFVQKENHKSDAINVIDTLADAIKRAIGVDDRWFCIDRVDWEIVKGGDAKIFIAIGQEQVGDAQACSYCGRILPFSQFREDKSRASGYRRECFDCTAPRAATESA